MWAPMLLVHHVATRYFATLAVSYAIAVLSILRCSDGDETGGKGRVESRKMP